MSRLSEKISIALKDPSRIPVFLIKYTNKIYSAIMDPFHTATDGFRRKQLLSKEGSWEIIPTTSTDLSKMQFSELSAQLNLMNAEFVEWNLAVSKQVDAEKPEASVIILVLNNLDMTLRCIDSVLTAKNKSSIEVIVVDNGSNARTIKGLRNYLKFHKNVKLIHIDQNVNFALGNNIGFTRASADRCIFLNNDTYVTDGWIDDLLAPLSNSRIRAVQPTLLYPDDTIQCIGIVFSDRSDIGYGMYVGLPHDADVVRDREVSAVTGACLAIRAKDFHDIKGFDPIFINGQEDIDLCLRVTENGKKGTCFVASSAVVYHDEGKTPGRGKFVAYNRKAFMDRWKGKITPTDLSEYTQDRYVIENWDVDSDEFRKMGIEVYIPKLKKEMI